MATLTCVVALSLLYWVGPLLCKVLLSRLCSVLLPSRMSYFWRVSVKPELVFPWTAFIKYSSATFEAELELGPWGFLEDRLIIYGLSSIRVCQLSWFTMRGVSVHLSPGSILVRSGFKTAKGWPCSPTGLHLVYLLWGPESLFWWHFSGQWAAFQILSCVSP